MSKLILNILGAVGLSAGFFYGSGLVANVLIPDTKIAKSAIKIEEPMLAKAPVAIPNTPVKFNIKTLLASADASNGQKLTMSLGCIACHSFNDGGRNGLGPNLYGVFGKQQASREGYQYSVALSTKKAIWNAEELNLWLIKPATYAPGTKMSYAGLVDDSKRADIIAYLNTLSAKPLPLTK